MGREPKNSGKEWTPQDINTLKILVNGNTPTGLIAHELGRSKNAVYKKASELNISVKPVNQRPYNRKNK